ncbi:hypothetical protein LV92_02194 [Arenibacter echinorum]|uniref:Uncharacterized protein n=1 Tax=Arenibacter echinorum TaxID=440515 RepID=A0A327R3G8_9FLAO|nr:hypothetical protein LV92_02194 [Arenibacter echinorum]
MVVSYYFIVFSNIVKLSKLCQPNNWFLYTIRLLLGINSKKFYWLFGVDMADCQNMVNVFKFQYIEYPIFLVFRRSLAKFGSLFNCLD